MKTHSSLLQYFSPQSLVNEQNGMSRGIRRPTYAQFSVENTTIQSLETKEYLGRRCRQTSSLLDPLSYNCPESVHLEN